MPFKLSSQEQEILSSLNSGYSERETYLRLGITHLEFASIWNRIRQEFESHTPQTEAGHELMHGFNRIERRKLEAELWASEARLAALMDTAPEAILVINGRSGRIERANNQSLLLFGYTQRELIGAEMELLIPDELKTIHVAYRHGFLTSVRKREMGYHPPINAKCKDGRLVQLDIALTATSATDDVMVVCKPSLETVESRPLMREKESS